MSKKPELDFQPVSWAKLPPVFWEAGIDLTGWERVAIPEVEDNANG